MSNPKTHRKKSAHEISTADHIVKVAGELFSDQGFHATSIRKISKECQVNLAAINYYFRDKYSLHQAVIRQASMRLFTDLGSAISISQIAQPYEQLISLVTSVLERFGRNGGRDAKLLLREMIDSGGCMRETTVAALDPTLSSFKRILALMSQSPPSDHILYQCSLGIIGRCFIYSAIRSALPQILPDLGPEGRLSNCLACQIVQNSLCSLTTHTKIQSRTYCFTPCINLKAWEEH